METGEDMFWMSSCPILRTRLSLGMLVVLEENRALATSLVLKMMGSWEWSIHPLFQSIFGCIAANQG
jgi:hypothetical protein